MAARFVLLLSLYFALTWNHIWWYELITLMCIGSISPFPTQTVLAVFHSTYYLTYHFTQNNVITQLIRVRTIIVCAHSLKLISGKIDNSIWVQKLTVRKNFCWTRRTNNVYCVQIVIFPSELWWLRGSVGISRMQAINLPKIPTEWCNKSPTSSSAWREVCQSLIGRRYGC